MDDLIGAYTGHNWRVRVEDNVQRIYSGSEDCNIRIWKSESDTKVGVQSKRERAKKDERRALVSKYKHHKQIKRIKKSHLPKYILTVKKRRQAQKESRFRKLENQRVNNAEIFEEPKPEKERKVVKKD